jgi:hypothetical protein
MAQGQAGTQSEVQELREQIARLEEELRESRSKSSGKQKRSERDSLSDNLENGRDEANRLLRGMFFAGLESLAVAADTAKIYVDKVTERNDERDGAGSRLVHLPVDMVEGMLDAADGTSSKIEQVVDKFYAKYKERKAS